jgi:hypothetical protein
MLQFLRSNLYAIQGRPIVRRWRLPFFACKFAYGFLVLVLETSSKNSEKLAPGIGRCLKVRRHPKSEHVNLVVSFGDGA